MSAAWLKARIFGVQKLLIAHASSAWLITWFISVISSAEHLTLRSSQEPWASKFLISLKIWLLLGNVLKINYLPYLAWKIFKDCFLYHHAKYFMLHRSKHNFVIVGWRYQNSNNPWTIILKRKRKRQQGSFKWPLSCFCETHLQNRNGKYDSIHSHQT